MRIAEFLRQVDAFRGRLAPTVESGDRELPQSTQRETVRRKKRDLVSRLRQGLPFAAENAITKIQVEQRELQTEIDFHARDILKANGQRSRLQGELARWSDAGDTNRERRVRQQIGGQDEIIQNGEAGIAACREKVAAMKAELVWFYDQVLVCDDLFEPSSVVAMDD